MASIHISLTPKLEEFIQELLDTGSKVMLARLLVKH